MAPSKGSEYLIDGNHHGNGANHVAVFAANRQADKQHFLAACLFAHDPGFFVEISQPLLLCQ